MNDELVKRLREAAEWEPCVMEREDAIKASFTIEVLSKRTELEYQSGFADGQRAANRKKNKRRNNDIQTWKFRSIRLTG